MAINYWNGYGDWFDSADWSEGAPPATTDDADIQSGEVTVDHANSPISVNSLTVEASLLLTEDDLTITGSAGLDISGGFVSIDVSPDADTHIWGGSTIIIDGTLTNSPTANARLYVGAANLEQATTVTATALDNDGGQIYLTGNTDTTPSASGLAQIDIGSAAGFGTAGEVTGTIDLTGNALVQFASGSITAIETGAILWLNGPNASVANSGGVANSAISTITSNAGTLQLQDEALTLDQGLTNTTTGYIDVDISGGGSTFNIDGVLDNQNYIDIGNAYLTAATIITATGLNNENPGNTQLQLHGSTATDGGRATLDIDSTAGFGTGTELTGSVLLDGNALLEFDQNGSISSIASGASLTLGGPDAFVADGDDTTHNSALTGLNENDGTLTLEDSALAVQGDLDNTGILDVDNSYAVTSAGYVFGGSILNIAGTLTNGPTANARLYIGDANLDQATTVTAAALDNDGGQIYLTGNTDTIPSASGLAQIDIGSTAGFGTDGEVTGTVDLTGNALLQFASGSITAIETGAVLWLNGPDASVADLNGGTNSAISDLTTNAGTLQLQDEALTLDQGLTNTTTGYIDVDISGGGSTFNIDGVLDNQNYIDIGNAYLTAATIVTATGLNNENPGNTQLQLHGSTATDGGRATLDIDSTAGFGTGTELTGSVLLDGNALLEFDQNGSISSIASGASLTLGGPDAFVADGDDTTHNSALTGLNENDGTLTLEDSELDLAGNFNNTGYLYVDNSYAVTPAGYVYGGSDLAISGAFSNSSNVFIGNSNLDGRHECFGGRARQYRVHQHHRRCIWSHRYSDHRRHERGPRRHDCGQ